MSRLQVLYRSTRLPVHRSGAPLHVTPRQAGWEYVDFGVRQLAGGATWSSACMSQECCLVLLEGACRVEWPGGRAVLGPRATVFAAYPHAVYLPPGTAFRVLADGPCELADCRARSRKKLRPRVIRPEDCGFEIRGGGNATRQIVDIIPPSFPADRLLICEVYTPGGNWSSYPPHKHDTDNPPVEVDLEEVYYYRFDDPAGYGFQRLYSAHRDRTVKVGHGDLVLVPDGFHTFVTAYGYHAYYLNVLAGTRRSMAASDDPRYAALRRTWPAPDPRVPLVPAPARAAVGQSQVNSLRRTAP